MPADDWDQGARGVGNDPLFDPYHSMRGLWIDGKPAVLAPPERQHAATLTDLIDRAAQQPPEGRWTV